MIFLASFAPTSRSLRFQISLAPIACIPQATFVNLSDCVGEAEIETAEIQIEVRLPG